MAYEAQAVDWLVREGHIRVVDVELPAPLPDWAQPVDSGEVQVIVLAQQYSADWVLIDNAHARRAARQANLPLKGTIGLLLKALREGRLTLQEFELLIQDMIFRRDPTFGSATAFASWRWHKRASGDRAPTDHCPLLLPHFLLYQIPRADDRRRLTADRLLLTAYFFPTSCDNRLPALSYLYLMTTPFAYSTCVSRPAASYV